MAKKNLINADMLLATPRKATELPAPTTATEVPTLIAVVTPEPIIQVTEVVQETNSAVASVKKGLKEHETRATFIVDENLLDKLKAIAYWERLNIKEVINDVFLRYIENYEKQKNEIKPIPQK